jgi:hypothetical protein
MERPSERETRSEMSGYAGEVVQARDIMGGIHFYRPGGKYRTPQQLPGAVAGFVNRHEELRALDAVLAPDASSQHSASHGTRSLATPTNARPCIARFSSDGACLSSWTTRRRFHRSAHCSLALRRASWWRRAGVGCRGWSPGMEPAG